MPSDPTHELALVGSLILDPSRIPEAAEIVSGRDFLDDTLGKAFDACVLSHDAGLPITDPRVLQREFRRLGVADYWADDAGIARLFQAAPHAAHARHYAETIRDAAALRRLALLGADLANRAKEAKEPDPVVDWLTATVATLGTQDAAQVVEGADVARAIVEELRNLKDRPRPTFSGVQPLDEFAGGWRDGELVILAARPSIGKTAFAMQTAMHQATRGRQVLVVSLEMRDRELMERQVAGLAGVDGRRLRGGDDLTPDELDALEYAASGVAKGLRIWAPPSATLARIRGVARHQKATGGLSLLVVDYLGLVRPADPRRPRWESVGEISAGLKSLAKELDVPVLALAQLNRDAEGADRPTLAQLRDSGAIEQDADVVLLLHRADRSATDAEIIVGKHRHGATGAVPLSFDCESTTFTARHEVFAPWAQ